MSAYEIEAWTQAALVFGYSGALLLVGWAAGTWNERLKK